MFLENILLDLKLVVFKVYTASNTKNSSCSAFSG